MTHPGLAKHILEGVLVGIGIVGSIGLQLRAAMQRVVDADEARKKRAYAVQVAAEEAAFRERNRVILSRCPACYSGDNPSFPSPWDDEMKCQQCGTRWTYNYGFLRVFDPEH